MTAVTCVLDARAAIGENPLWSVPEQVLYWIDAAKGALYRYDPASGATRTWRFPAVIGSFAPRVGGGLLIALGAGLYTVDLETMATAPVADPVCDPAETRLNDGRCDPAGRFWVGAMDLQKTRPIAGLYRVDPGRPPRRLVDGVIVSNGLAWSPDGGTLYHADSRQRTIWVAQVDPETGDLRSRRVFATVPPGEGLPDGAALDVEGGYWSARVGGGRLVRHAPDGRVDRVIRLPVSWPSMCAFGGAKLDVLYVTSAREFLSGAELAREPQAGGVFALDVGVSGLPEPFYRG